LGTENSACLNTDRIVLFMFMMAVAALVAFKVYIERKNRNLA
jgi:hypothetical protein